MKKIRKDKEKRNKEKIIGKTRGVVANRRPRT